MGRASNPAAPQRVSAHVLPKVPSFASDDEDEKTMIESGWEEESSTTVEQGEVAEKLRALGLGLDAAQRANSSITSTSAGGTSEEPTVDQPAPPFAGPAARGQAPVVDQSAPPFGAAAARGQAPVLDDQRARAAVALLPPPIVARLVITQGNDSGQALEVRAGKTYTIGRGIDNDLVLTDIAVSRKHFDVRNDNGAWVIADRGSGNGTLVNQRIEDAPFVLASGDVIEIGNTSFRFDVASGVPRAQPLGADGSDDDRSLAPVGSAAEGRRGLIDDDDLELATAGQTIRDPERVQTPAPLPGLPIAPPSARSKTQPPPGMLPATLPPPRSPMNRPLVGYGLERPGTQSQPPPPSALAMTIGPVHTALPASPLAQSTLPLPQMANRPPLGSALRDAGNGAGTTLPGSGPASPTPPRRAFSYPGTLSSPSQPQPRPRPSASTQAVRDPTSTAQVQPITYAGGAALAQPPVRAPQRLQISPRTRLALGAAAAVLVVAVVTLAIISSTRSTPVAPPPAPRANTAPLPRPPPIVEAIHEPATPTAVAAPSGSAAVVPPRAPAPIPPLPTTAPPSSKLAIVVEPAHDARPPAKPAVVAPPIVERPAVVRPRLEPPPTRLELRKPAPKRVPDRKPEPKKAAPSKMEIAPIPDSDKPDLMPTKADRKRTGRSALDIKNDAMALYRGKNFNGASAVVAAALPSYTGGDAQDLRTIATIYAQLGKSYNIGMAPGTKATDAYIALLRARGFDRDLGGSYIPEIEQRLATVSARAASSFMAAKEYESAAQAVKIADSLGTAAALTTKSVREALEGVAGELVRAAQAELTSNPDAARKKLRQVQGIVDAKHPAAIKATKLLSGL